jgi:acetyl-CoA C-acetyltransferase
MQIVFDWYTLNALEQENKRTGIATACIGGGLGIALMIDKGE